MSETIAIFVALVLPLAGGGYIAGRDIGTNLYTSGSTVIWCSLAGFAFGVILGVAASWIAVNFTERESQKEEKAARDTLESLGKNLRAEFNEKLKILQSEFYKKFPDHASLTPELEKFDQDSNIIQDNSETDKKRHQEVIKTARTTASVAGIFAGLGAGAHLGTAIGMLGGPLGMAAGAAIGGLASWATSKLFSSND